MSLTVGTTVPLYNSSAFILQLLESICQQSTKLDQVVLVDDASIDNTPNIVEDFISKNKSHCKDFHLIKLKSNSGPSFSANIGIHNLNTDIVLFSGHDDIWSFDRTEESMKLFENGFDFIFSQYETFGIKNETIYVHTNWADTALEMMGKNSIGAITVGVNASKIGKKNLFFNSRFDGAEDFDLWTDLILLGYQPYGIQKSLMKYRTSESQLSRNFDYKGSGIIKKIQLKYISQILPLDLLPYFELISDIACLDSERSKLITINNELMNILIIIRNKLIEYNINTTKHNEIIVKLILKLNLLTHE